jgi:hypothetical protein
MQPRKRKTSESHSTEDVATSKEGRTGDSTSEVPAFVPEIWKNIISYLAFPEKVLLCGVCKWFYNFVPTTWTSLCLSAEWPRLTGSKFAALAYRAGHTLREVIVEDRQGRHGRNLLTSNLEGIANHCPNIERLRIKNSCTNVHEFEAFMCQQVIPKFQQLKVSTHTT